MTEVCLFTYSGHQGPCRRTACQTCMTAGDQSGMAITTMRTMGMVMLVAAQVDTHADVQIMTPTSEHEKDMQCVF